MYNGAMLSLYNTLSRKEEKFKSLKRAAVNFYVCGPTVYDRAHIGNLRTFIFEDILRRTLEYNGYQVRQVVNITDIEDKIIKRLKLEKRRKIEEITRPYTKLFFEDIKKLNIEKAESYPLVTRNIGEIIKLIQKLLAKGTAYKSKDGSVYFNISKFRKYGELSRLKKVSLKAGARISADEYEKGEAGDFVLWKAKKRGEPYWKSPFGDGRPGWHIECSTLGIKFLGKTLDIHAGGVDLIFPHHENEIAQSEAVTGKKFVNYWLHGEHLLINRKKMAKSLRNFYTLEDLEKRGFNPLSFRYLVLNAHYRSKLNFTWDALGAAQNGLYKLYDEVKAVYLEDYYIRSKFVPWRDIKKSRSLLNYKERFSRIINDDLNTPKVLALLWAMLADPALTLKDKIMHIEAFDKILGLKLKQRVGLPPSKVRGLVKEREEYRTDKQFVHADRLRKKIESLGYTVEDTSRGPFVKKNGRTN